MVHIKAVVVVSLFFLLNVGLSLLNRWALGVKGFSFPIFLTMFQALFLFTLILCSSVFIPKVRGMTGGSRRTMVKEWKGVVWVGIWTSLNVVLNNFSLVYISLSLNQVLRYVFTCAIIPCGGVYRSQWQLYGCCCRSSIPLVTAVVSSIHGRKMPTKAEVFGLFVLCGGVVIAIGEASANGNAFGVMLCLASVVAGAYMLTTTAHTLHEKMSSFQLAFMTAPVTVSCLLPPFFAFESGVVAEYVVLNPHMTAMILLSGSILASAYNVVHNELVGIVGPVTTTVLGQVKIVSLMLLSGILFGTCRPRGVLVRCVPSDGLFLCRGRKRFLPKNEYRLLLGYIRIQHIFMGEDKSAAGCRRDPKGCCCWQKVVPYTTWCTGQEASSSKCRSLS